MPYYNPKLKSSARSLRANQTAAEKLLWSRIRRKQLCNVQFFRQKPIGHYIVDFYAPTVKLVIELDGGQHFDEDHIKRDNQRDQYLTGLNLKVLRFNNLQILNSLNNVLELLFHEITLHQTQNPLPCPLL